MNTTIPNDKLGRIIQAAGQTALEARQVAKRLRALLPTRFRDIRSEHSRTGSYGSGAERLALTDPRFIAFLEELAEIDAQGSAARIKYETYSMLFEARRTLRAFNK